MNTEDWIENEVERLRVIFRHLTDDQVKEIRVALREFRDGPHVAQREAGK